MAFDIYNEFSQRGYHELITMVGYAMADVTVNDNGTNKTMKLNLGCLHDNWELRYEPETEELPDGCSPNKYTRQKAGTWKGKIDVKRLSPFLQAALTGGKLVPPTSSDILLVETERLTVASDVVTSAVVTTVAAIASVVSVKNTNTDQFYYRIPTETPALTPDTTKPQFVLADGVTVTFPATGDYACADGDVIEITYLRWSSTATDGVIVQSLRTRSIAEMDFYFTWLAVNDDTGDTWEVVAYVKNAMPTSGFNMGGAGHTESITQTLEFSVNESADGDVSFHWNRAASTYVAP